MKPQIEQLLHQTGPLIRFVRRYMVFFVFLVFALIYIVLEVRINHFAASEPTDAQVSSKVGAMHQPKIDLQTVDKIEQLQTQNIQVKALFDQARNNPFAE